MIEIERFVDRLHHDATIKRSQVFRGTPGFLLIVEPRGDHAGLLLFFSRSGRPPAHVVSQLMELVGLYSVEIVRDRFQAEKVLQRYSQLPPNKEAA